jgi:hypothetical protein
VSGDPDRRLIARGPQPAEVLQVRPDVPPRLSWLIARLMERDPDRRLRDPSTARRALLSLHPVAAPGG